jgi:methionine-rich copper-binding protein CopC
MTKHRFATATVIGRAACTAGAAPALAHTEVKSTSPGKGKTASTSLRTVTVSFTQTIRSGSLRVKKVGGGKVSKGSGGRDPRKVSRLKVRLKRGLRSGRYKASWTIKAVDGHTQSGSFRFKLG